MTGGGGGGGGGGPGGFIDRRAGSSFRLSIIPGVTLDLFPDGVIFDHS